MLLQELSILIFNRYFVLFFFGMLIYLGFFAKRVPLFLKTILVIVYSFFLLGAVFPLAFISGMAFDAPGSDKQLLPYLVPFVGLFFLAIPGIAVYKIIKKPR